MAKNPFKKDDASQGRSTRSVKVLGPEEFLYTSKGGYWDKPDSLLGTGEQLRDTDAFGLSTAFKFMKSNVRCISESDLKLDKGGNPYRFYQFNRSGNAQTGVKVLMVGPMEQIMTDYQDGLLQITFDLEELVEVARSL